MWNKTIDIGRIYKILMKSKGISKTAKMKIYKTTIRTVVTSAAKTMCFTNRDKQIINAFKRRTIRKRNGPKRVNEEDIEGS